MGSTIYLIYLGGDIVALVCLQNQILFYDEMPTCSCKKWKILDGEEMKFLVPVHE